VHPTLNSPSPLKANAQGLQAEKVKAHRQIRRVRPWDHKTLTEVLAIRMANLRFSNFLSCGPAPRPTGPS
jgi:hypothetical protein